MTKSLSHSRYNPLHVAAACATLVLALVMLLDPLFPPSPASDAGAVGDSVGLDVLGQTNGDEGYFDSGSTQDQMNAVQLLPDDIVLDPVGHRLFVSNGQTGARVLVFDLDSGNNLIDHVADAVLGAPNFKSFTAGLDADVFSTGPLGMAYDTDNERLFVADSSNNRVLVFDAGTITSGEDAVNVLGQADFTSNGIGTDEFTMDTPTGLAYDNENDRLFVSDRGNNRVLVFELSGGTSDGMAASNVLGQPNFATNTNTTTQSGLYLAGTFGVVPELVYMSATGGMPDSLFVSDYNNARVMVFDVDTIDDGELAANVLGASDFTTGIGGVTSDTNIALHSTGLAYDSAEEILYVSDDVDRILLFDLSDGVSDGEAAIDVVGQPSFIFGNPYCPDDNSNDVCSSSIDSPQGMEFDPDNDRLYVATTSSERVSIFEDANDGNPPPAEPPFAVDNLGQLDGADNPVYENTENISAYGMNAPESVALDEDNHRLFVADTANNRVLMFNLSIDNEISERAAAVSFGQRQVYNYTPSEGSPLCVTEFFRSGDVNNGGPSGGPGECGDNSVSETGFSTPTGLVYDTEEDRLFVTDSGNNRVLVFQGPFDSGMSATNVLGQPNFTSSTFGTSATELNSPKDVDYDSANQRLFVADSGNDRVFIYDLSGGITDGMAATGVLGAADLDMGGDGGLSPFNPDTLGGPEGVTYDATNDRLFVADFFRDRVVVYDLVDLVPPGSGLTPQSHVLGQEDFDSYGPRGGADGLDFTDCFYCSSNLHMAYDVANDRLVVPDRFNHRIMVFDVAPGTIANGEDAFDVIAQTNFDDTDAGLSQNRVSMPQGVALDSVSGNVFVADTQNNRLMVFGPPEPPVPGGATAGHEATDVVGQLTGADVPIFTEAGADNSPNSRGFSGPEGVTIDAVNHRLFEVDPGNHRVLVFDLDSGNELIDRIADHVLGQTNFRSNGNGTDQAKMTFPLYPAYDPDNDLLFVSDYSNNRVMVFDVATIDDGEDAVNVLGQPDFTTTTVVLSDTGMSNPRGVAYDPTTSRLFVGSQDHQRVLVYDLSGGIADGMAASWVLGQEDFDTSGPNLDQDGLSAGNNLTLDIEGQLLFVDDSPSDRVMVWDVADITNGEDAVHVLGQEDFNSGDPDLDADSFDFSGLYGNGLAHDPDNNRLFVADGSNRRIMVFDVSTIDDGEDAINVLGQTDFTSADDSLSQHSTRAAGGLAYDADNGLLYTTTKGDVGQENPDNRSSIFDVNSIDDGEDAADLLGQLDEDDAPFYTSRGVDNRPNQLGFNSTHGVAVDQVNHRLFTADFNNNRVLVFELDADNNPDNYAADFVIGQPDFKSVASAADDPQAYNFNNGPQSVLYHEENDWLLVNDANGNRVLVFDMAALANGMDALYVLGQPDFTTHDCCNVSDSEFLSSEGIALDAETNFLYVPDGGHNRVLVFDLSTISNGMSASFVLGQPDFSTEDANDGPDGMNNPRGAAVDAVGQRLFVSDNGNRRVLVFDTSVLSNGMAAGNVLGQDDFTSSEEAVSQARVSDPAGLAFDGERNRLFVSDPNSSRVMVFSTTSITDGEDAVDAYGQATFTDSDCNTTRSGLCVPKAVYYDTDQRTLYVADAANNRVLIFGPTGGGGGPAPTPEPVGITPDKIVVNQDSSVTDSRNVLVTVWATNTPNFTGTVDVLLSNDPMFNTFVPFRYNVPGPGGEQNIWPKTIAWDLCFGLTGKTCDPGRKTVYARFYVNVPLPTPCFDATTMKNGKYNYNPLHVAATCATLVLVLVMLLDPLFPPSPASQAGAIGGYSAVDQLGQLDTAGSPVYGNFKQNNGPNAFGFDDVFAVAMDSVRHRLFVSDGNNRVLVYELDLSNALVDRIADNVLGKADMKDRSDGPTAALISQSQGLAVDEAGGRLFVADSGRHRVLVFDVSTVTDGEDAVNVLGQADFTSGGSALPSQNNLSNPTGLAYDSTSDRLFVVESGGVHRVTVFDAASITDNENAINVLGQPNFTSSGAATSPSRLNNPTHAVVDEGGQRLFVLDLFANRVMVFDIDTGVLIPDNPGSDGPDAINVLGHADFFSTTSGLSQSEFDFASDFNPGIGYDNGSDRLFVGDGGNQRVMVFDVNSITDGENAVSVLGQTDFTTNGGTASQSQFGSRTGGLFYDTDNDLLYATDEYQHRILIFAAGTITNGEDAVDQLGQLDSDNEPDFDANATPDNGPSNRGFAYPESVALDTANHRMFVTDADNGRVLVFDLDSSNLLIDHIADHVLGQEDFRGQDGVVDADGLRRPSALAYRESTDELFVADQDRNRVLVFDVSTVTDGEDAVSVLGQDVFTTDGCATDADSMCTPRAVGLDDEGDRLFVVDSENNRITVFDLSDGIDDGEDAVNVLGQFDLNSNGSGNNVNTLNGPLGAAFDGDGQRLFVVDGENNRVMVFDVSSITDGQDATNQLGTGNRSTSQNEFSLDLLDESFTQPCEEGETNAQPVFDSVNNRLFVPDSCNNRVMVFDTTTITDQEDAVDVVGQDNFDFNGNSGAQDRLNVPQGLAFNPANNYLYVSDTGNHRVMVFQVPPQIPGATAGHNATNVVGQLDDSDEPIFTTGGADNGPNRRGSSQPIGIAIDHINHRLFASDYDNGRVMVYDLDSSDEMVDRVADAVLGQDDFKHGICGGGANRMCNPNGLALDEEAGLLFIASFGGNRVLVFDVNEVDNGEDAINVLGQPDFDSSTEATSQTGMHAPNGVEWYEEDQELFVADAGNNRVLVFDLSGGIADGMPASHVLGQPNFDTGTPSVSAAGMDFPSDMEYVGALPDSGLEHLYVSDRTNCRVTVFDISTIDDGEDAAFVLGQPNLSTNDCGTDSDSFLGTAGLSHNEADGLVFVTDFPNNRVLVFDVNEISNGEPATTVIGQPDFDTNTAATGPEGLSDPEGVYYDDDNDLLYITDTGNHRVLTYDGTALEDGVAAVDGFAQLNPDDTVNFTANKPNNGPNIQGFDEADYAALDTVNHRLFATDLGNNRVLVFNLDSSNRITDYDADFVLGQPDFKSNTGAAGPNGLFNASGLSYDGLNDRLFVADAGNARILVFDTTTITNGEDAVNVLGQADFDGSGCGTSATTMCAPLDVSVEPINGLLAVGDRDNNRILVFDISGGISDGMAATKVFCQPDFDSSGSGTASDACTGPQGVLAETNTDSLWVTDSDNNRVLRFDLFGVSSDPALNVLGQDDFTSSSPATDQARMDNPVRLALLESDGSDQRLFVSDIDNNRVLVFNTADGIDDGEDAVDAYGQPDFTSNGCGTSRSNLCAPVGLDYDETLRTLYIADKANNRILIFGPTGGGGGPAPTPEPVGITPDKIVVNQDSSVTDSRNVLVTVWATNTPNFTGTVDVLLSNDPMFNTFVPFRYNVPGPGGEQNIWPKTIAWDLCFGLTGKTCDPGRKTVYARFYVNVPLPTPVLTPRP